MASKQFISDIVNYIHDNQSKINFNQDIFEIMEGNLLHYVKDTLNDQLSGDSGELAAKRAAPINVWNKIVKKLSKLYVNKPVRTTEISSDQDLLDYYIKSGIDKHFGNFNENYNSYKWSALEIYEDPTLQELKTRSVPSNQFLAYSDDQINPLRPTAIIKFMGTVKDAAGKEKNKYWVYTADEFIPIYDDETIATEDLAENDGENPYDVIPFEYVTMSDYLLVPMPDQDTKQMTIMLAVCISDQNFGAMYLSHPLIYTTDADSENMPASPNHFLNIKSDDPERQANVGVVKAEPDLQAQMDHVLRQLAMWLETRDINAGSIGKMDGENVASGISKIISEMDTLENRKMQEIVFREVELKFWRRLAQIHNTLAKVGRIKNRKLFSDPSTLEVHIDYPQADVIEAREVKVARLVAEVNGRLNSRRRAIKELNPNIGESELDALLEEIDGEAINVIEVEDEEDGEV